MAPHCHLGCFMTSTKVFKGWSKNPRYETNDLFPSPGTDVSHQGSSMKKMLVPMAQFEFTHPEVSWCPRTLLCEYTDVIFTAKIIFSKFLKTFIGSYKRLCTS